MKELTKKELTSITGGERGDSLHHGATTTGAILKGAGGAVGASVGGLIDLVFREWW